MELIVPQLSALERDRFSGVSAFAQESRAVSRSMRMTTVKTCKDGRMSVYQRPMMVADVPPGVPGCTVVEAVVDLQRELTGHFARLRALAAARAVRGMVRNVDAKILSCLRKACGEERSIGQLLEAVGISDRSLRVHLGRLMAVGKVERIQREKARNKAAFYRLVSKAPSRQGGLPARAEETDMARAKKPEGKKGKGRKPGQKGG